MEELQEMLTSLQRMTGKDVFVEQVLMVSTDDPSISVMLDGLKDAIEDGNGQPVFKRVKKVKKIKASSNGNGNSKHEPTRGPHVKSIKWISANEMIRRFQLNKMLEERTIGVGDLLHSPKYGDIRVDVRDGAFIVVNDQGEQV
jgi:hypothetical protein